MMDPEAAKKIERGVIVVQINLFWGQVEWRASTSQIIGTCLDGTPFTITDVTPRALVRWLKGTPIREAFPAMDACDRNLLINGEIREIDDEPTSLQIPRDCVPHPGASIREHLEARDWSQRELAIRTKLSPKTIRELCSGKTHVTPAIATALARVLQRPAQWWLNMQTQYDEAQRCHANEPSK